MKKIFVLLLAAFLMTAGLTACGSSSEEQNASDDAAGINVVTTVFPIYDWTRNIVGEDNAAANINMLIDSGVDLHSYQPSAEDILNISKCDVFIYVGGESDEWVEDALGEAVNENMVVVNLMDALGDMAKEEEIVEGMQADEHEHEHEGEEAHEEGEEEHEEGEEHEHEEKGPEYDEHIWLSLRNASFLADTIAEALAQADEANAEAYSANAAAYKEKLDALDAEYTKAVEASPVHTLLFGDRFPFRYMTDDYGLDYYAAFIGCSAETEASFETIAFLSAKVDELGLKNVMTIEGADHSIAESIINNTKTKDQTILTLDSMQSSTADDVASGSTYLSIMEGNLEVLKEALK